MRYHHIHLPDRHRVASTIDHWVHDSRFWLLILMLFILTVFMLLAIYASGTNTGEVRPVFPGLPYGY